ncbi:MAG TPA: HesA/MoeB/ThiF family protein [Desulfomonilia bacterium]|nr:HesA/MoeB/ThiF family protein [Desulfomonilia bacterium]
MGKLHDYLISRAKEGILSCSAEAEAASEFAVSFKDIEIAALEAEIVPSRYLRNRNTLSYTDQIVLLKSHVAIVGCGGLGGYIIEGLARLGIGKMTVIDPDSFEEHNLNRQILCTMDVLGKPKVEAARARIKTVNPAVEVAAIRDAFSQDNGRRMLMDVQVVLDGLDNIPVRIQLGEVCSALGIPLIHGSIGGWYGQITTQMPGQHTILEIYQNHSGDEGIEKALGNPAFSPALIASLQAAEACKVLIGTGNCLSRRMLFFNMLDMEMEILEL